MTRIGPARTIPSAGFLLFAAGYAMAIALSERAYGSLEVPSPFWLPDAVVLVALLRVPPARWWMFLAAMGPIRLLMGAPAGTPLWFVVASVGNDVLKALGAAWFLTRITRRTIRLETLSEFLVFLGIAGTAAPVLSAVAGAPAREVLGDPIWPATYKWLLGDVLAQIIVTPTLLYWCTGGYRQVRGRLGEFALLMSLLTIALVAASAPGRSSYSVTLLYVPVPFLIWAATRLRPFGTANAITLVAIVSMIGAVRGVGVFGNDTPAQSVLSLQLFLLVLAVPLLLLAILVAERERLHDRETDFNSRLLEAQDRERARIARDLHDDLAQRMALLHVGLETVGRNRALGPGAEEEVRTLALIADEMSSDLRQLSHRLHPSTLDLVGLESAVRSLCTELGTQHGLRVDLRFSAVPRPIERDIGICVFRIAQEALRNVVKHSGAGAAVVELSSDGERLVLCVGDAGAGFDGEGARNSTGLGLISMRERLRPIGGRLSIESAPGAGTQVRAEVPLRTGDTAAAISNSPDRWRVARQA